MRVFAPFVVGLAAATSAAAQSRPFAIHVVDDQTARGVPLVELRTVNEIRYYTDSAGYVAFDEPGLMGRDVCFHVASDGYEHPADGFGFRVARLHPEPGGAAEIKIHRLNIAERLYRVAGGGIYRDSVLLGKPVPIAEPTLNGLVLGQDSVLNAVYHGRLFWFWGDTSWPAYPLGNFQTAGATSRLPTDGGLAPGVGVNLEYFTDERGFAKQMSPVPGDGPTWIDGVVTLHDPDGRERLFATYAKVRQDMSAHGRGFLEFDPAANEFRRLAEFDPNAPLVPGGHPFLHAAAGQPQYVYFTRPYPAIRLPADPRLYADLSRYRCYTCLAPGCTSDQSVLDRAADGTLLWDWKAGAAPLVPQKQEELIRAGQLRPADTPFRLHDIETGKVVLVHGGSVYWNDYRRRWIMIALELFGTSVLGEVWYTEADTPLGPWCYARKIVTHKQYSFYNPKQHPEFDEQGGRIIYFEGTYSATFSGNPAPTPRYDYNQIMYRLDLEDPRLILPIALYAIDDPPGYRAGPATYDGDHPAPRPLFLACDRAAPGSTLVADFHALPANLENPPPTTVALFAWRNSAGQLLYRPAGLAAPSGYRRDDTLTCRVWCDPATLPVQK